MSRILSVFAVLAIALAGVAGIATPAQATTTNISIDCGVPLNGGNFYSTGNDLIFTTTNCSDVDQDGNSLLPNIATFTVLFSSLSTSNYTRLKFYDTNSLRVADLKVYAATSNVTTVGSLSLASTQTITIPASSPSRFDYTYENGFSGGCSLTQGRHPYQTVTITTTSSGDFTFRVSATSPDTSSNGWALTPSSAQSPIVDPWMAVYTTFDPANPEQNFLGCNDDSGQDGNFFSDGTVLSPLWPQFDVTALPAGSYTLVLSSYGAITDSSWITKAGGVDQTASMQLWGSVGAISAVTNPSVTNNSNNNGSNTNSSSSNSNSNNSSNSQSSSSSSSSNVSGASATVSSAMSADSTLAVTGYSSSLAFPLTSLAAVSLLAGAALTVFRNRIRSKE